MKRKWLLKDSSERAKSDKFVVRAGGWEDRERLIDPYFKHEDDAARDLAARISPLEPARKLEYVWPSFKSSKVSKPLSRVAERHEICHFYRSGDQISSSYALFFRFLLSSRDPITPQAKHIACEFA